jgi:hypothetical protein
MPIAKRWNIWNILKLLYGEVNLRAFLTSALDGSFMLRPLYYLKRTQATQAVWASRVKISLPLPISEPQLPGCLVQLPSHYADLCQLIIKLAVRYIKLNYYLEVDYGTKLGLSPPSPNMYVSLLAPGSSRSWTERIPTSAADKHFVLHNWRHFWDAWEETWEQRGLLKRKCDPPRAFI